jgi:hypothetical protein
MSYPIVELRQYTLHPGRRDELIELFDREFVETQEAVGARILGQFRDLDRPDRFVWVRGFSSMAARAEALTAFYSGPVWRAHRDAANATMIDCDDVLLLRPAGSGFDLDPSVRDVAPTSLVAATICHLSAPVDEEFVHRFDRDVVPLLDTKPLARLSTEYAENNFPALPVRTGEHVFVWFASVTGREHAARLADVPMGVRTEHLVLEPTPRSLLR